MTKKQYQDELKFIIKTPIDIKYLIPSFDLTTFISTNKENLIKNRDINSICYDYNRVKLSKSQSDYINASFVIIHPGFKSKFIITQDPLKNSISDFWLMVLEYESDIIVTLNNSSENVIFI